MNGNPHLDRLDNIAAAIVMHKDAAYLGAYDVLSTGEKLYVALAANRSDLLAEHGYTMAEALHRLDTPWLGELVQRWKHGIPRAARVAVSSGSWQS